MRTQRFGMEIEMTGITRERAAQVIGGYFGTAAVYAGGGYYTHKATDRQGRIWKCMRDGSIHCQKKRDGRRVSAGSEYSTEVVTPILSYEDIPDLQEIVRQLGDVFPEIECYWLIARRADRLESLAISLPERHTACIALDLCDPMSFMSLKERLAEAVKEEAPVEIE